MYNIRLAGAFRNPRVGERTEATRREESRYLESFLLLSPDGIHGPSWIHAASARHGTAGSNRNRMEGLARS